MAHDCMPHATNRSPPTCRLPNDSGRVTILLWLRFLQGEESSIWWTAASSVGQPTTKLMAHDCMPQATHRLPPTFRLPNDPGRVAISFHFRSIQGEESSIWWTAASSVGQYTTNST